MSKIANDVKSHRVTCSQRDRDVQSDTNISELTETHFHRAITLKFSGYAE